VKNIGWPDFWVARIAMGGRISFLVTPRQDPYFMRPKEVLDSAKLVQAERRRWQDNHLLGPAALSDFQKLSDEAFISMKSKYYRPADLIREVRSRVFSKLKSRRPIDWNRKGEFALGLGVGLKMGLILTGFFGTLRAVAEASGNVPVELAWFRHVLFHLMGLIFCCLVRPERRDGRVSAWQSRPQLGGLPREEAPWHLATTFFVGSKCERGLGHKTVEAALLPSRIFKLNLTPLCIIAG
jgi:hypothetical protein